MKTAPLFALLLLASAPAAYAETFEFETITQHIIFGPSLAIDASGDAHVAYYLVTNSDGAGPAYSHRHLGVWTTEFIEKTSIYNAALALDPAGNPHVAYYPAGDARVRYASLVGGQWVIEIVDGWSQVAGDLALAIDAQGQPHIAYPFDNTLKHATRTGAGWTSEVVDPDVGTSSYPGISLKFDPAGHPIVSYHGGTRLWFARQVSGAWSAVPVVNADPYVQTSLAVDGQGMACFAYGDANGQHLAHETAAGWTTEPVENGAGVGGSASLAFDGAGDPHLGYYDGNHGSVRYAHRSGGTWIFQTVDDRFRSGQAMALALDPLGTPEIAYTFRGYTGGTFRYATTPTVTGVGDVAGGLSFAPPSPSPSLDGHSTLRFSLPAPANVSFALYDLAGRRVATRAAERFEAGPQVVRWDAGTRAAGVYFVRLVTDEGAQMEQRWVRLR